MPDTCLRCGVEKPYYHLESGYCVQCRPKARRPLPGLYFSPPLRYLSAEEYADLGRRYSVPRRYPWDDVPLEDSLRMTENMLRDHLDWDKHDFAVEDGS